ncbi:MAG TPA: hypothetical protein VN706_09750 [Gemmatimonadaceae bacterium]|nr:hypothetical protein [Gemmatimonadaceae bacterium]
MNILKTLIAVAILAAPLAAQRPDSISGRITTIPNTVDTTLKPPISPRRAFFYSFLAPGYSQTRLGRHKAAAAFMLVEAISIGMLHESAADAHEARRFVDDSIVQSYQGTAATIQDPRFTSREIRSRDAHVEDWAALLVANHLFAGADAFVAAHLWDVPVKLGLRMTPRGTALTASLRR